MADLSDPNQKYPEAALQEAVATLAGPRRQNGAAAGSRREKLPAAPAGSPGRKALITGGDFGMGRAAAIAYAREGADVAINYFPNEEPDAQEVIALIKDEGRKGLALPGDLRDEAFCKKLVEDAVKGLGGLDILVCNAARQQSRESILEVSSEDFDATMKTNIYAPFWIIKAALPHLKPGSAIIGTTSRAGLRSLAGALRLRADQGRHDELREIAGQATGLQGHPGQWRRAGSDLDAAPGFRRRQHGEARAVRRQHRIQAPGPTRRTRFDLRSSRRGGRELHDRPGVWSSGGAGQP